MNSINKSGLPSNAIVMLLVLSLSLTLASCGTDKTEQTSSADELLVTDVTNEASGFGYVYPTDPAYELRTALNEAVANKSLPVTVGEVELITYGEKEQAMFTLQFSESENVCAIVFELRSIVWDFDYDLNGYGNPSFVMALKDPQNSEDLKTILAAVLQCLSPSLSDEEAQAISENQDATVSVDGYSQPFDTDGYQVVTRRTAPQTFYGTRDFDSSYGVKITALQQIWSEQDLDGFTELKTSSDYFVLTTGYTPWEDDYQVKTVYADFMIRNVWHYTERVHGSSWVEVEVESMDSNRYTLRLNTIGMPTSYEFGIGQRYTLYIKTGTMYGTTILHALQRTTSTTPNYRGVSQPLDNSTNYFDNPLERIEPEADGTVYDVSFNLIIRSMAISEPAAVLEGSGVGEGQWPTDPVREGYEFVGWYDNKEWSGKPYSLNTPIYQDTRLYPRWRYIGSGGCWPRPHRGEVHGIEEGSVLSIGQRVTIVADGYNMSLETPQDQRFRWRPIGWRLTDGMEGSFAGLAPVEADLEIDEEGDAELYISYLEEVFDGIDWQETGQICEVPEIAFKIK